MARIVDYDGIPCFEHEVGGRRYCFTVQNVAEDSRQWLCEVVGDHMDEIYRHAVKETQQRIRAEIKKALML